MVGITKRIEERYPIFNTGTMPTSSLCKSNSYKTFAPHWSCSLGRQLRFLIACANVANLLRLAPLRGAGKSPFAHPWAPAASRLRQLLTESVLSRSLAESSDC